MLVYAGIDEAGYGPMFGPMVIARCAFILDKENPSSDPPSLWSLLKPAVCKGGKDRKGRIAIHDSKKLYSPVRGLHHIERGVLSFLSNSGASPPNLRHLLQILAYDERSWRIPSDWYDDEEGGPVLPFCVSSFDLEKTKACLDRALDRACVYLDDLSAAVVFEDRFNEIVRATGSKSFCAWNFVSAHLRWLWKQYSPHHPVIIIDRQGGRINYAPLIQALFPTAEVKKVQEEALSSQYRVSRGSHLMHLIFQVKSESCHFPAALASMTAKYLRELLMKRFQRYWRAKAPEVRPTCGYVKDGRRFLKEIEPIIISQNIDQDKLVRLR